MIVLGASEQIVQPIETGLPDDRHLYVVDDDAKVLQSVKAVLVQYGYSPLCFQSAESFLREAIQDRPGCIITDLQMPGINGLELQERLLANGSPLSVIFLTGIADVPTVVKIMSNGAATLLEKPYASDALVEAVENALDASVLRWQNICQRQRVRMLEVTLTDEERTVMKMMLSGIANKNIASTLDIGMRTVDRRRHSIFTKMGVSTVAELAVMLSCLTQGHR
jgi:two-component system, LuxR family, response regulator FixJ